MIDSIIVRPFLRLTTWVKRHPFAAAIVIVILFLLPPLIVAVYSFLQGVVNFVKRFFGIAAAEKAYAIVSKVGEWLSAAPHRCYWLALGVAVVSPLAGAALAVWCFLDTFKDKEGVSAKIELDGRQTTPGVEPPAPDLGVVVPEVPVLPDFNDVFVGQV